MPDNPTAAELRTLRKLGKRAGGEAELHRWVRRAYARPRGRPLGSTHFHDYDEEVLLIAEMLHLCSRGKLSLHRALKLIVTGDGPRRWTRERGGASPDAMIKRLLAKAQEQRVKDEKTEITEDQLRNLPRMLDELDALVPGTGPFFKALIWSRSD